MEIWTMILRMKCVPKDAPLCIIQSGHKTGRKVLIMKLKNMPTAIGLLALFLAQTPANATDFDNDLDKTFQVSPGGSLILDADQGSCDVATTAVDKVQIRVLRKTKNATQAQADELFANHQVTFEKDGQTVSVVAKNKKNASFRTSNSPWLEVRYVIEIPKKFDLDLRTSGGDLRVADLDGKVKARTSSGAIRLQSATGDVTADDSGG